MSDRATISTAKGASEVQWMNAGLAGQFPQGQPLAELRMQSLSDMMKPLRPPVRGGSSPAGFTKNLQNQAFENERGGTVVAAKLPVKFAWQSRENPVHRSGTIRQ
jgi:hypothetical protein